MPEFTYVDGDDWNGLYKDGELIWQGHSLSTYQVFKFLGIALDMKAADGDWLYDKGNLPQYLKDVVELE